MVGKHSRKRRLAVAMTMTAAAVAGCGDTEDTSTDISAAASQDVTASTRGVSLENLAIRDLGEVRSTVDLGDGLTLAPNDAAPAITTADAVDVLDESGVWVAVTNGAQEPIVEADAYEGRISEEDFEQITTPGMPKPPSDVAEPPKAVKDRPAVVVIFRNVRWMGLHGGGGPVVPDVDAATTTTQTYASQDVLVAFDADTSELIFLRTLGPVG